MSMVENNKEPMKMAVEGGTLITTNCAHTLAEYTNRDISGANGGSSNVRLSYFG